MSEGRQLFKAVLLRRILYSHSNSIFFLLVLEIFSFLATYQALALETYKMLASWDVIFGQKYSLSCALKMGALLSAVQVGLNALMIYISYSFTSKPAFTNSHRKQTFTKDNSPISSSRFSLETFQLACWGLRQLVNVGNLSQEQKSSGVTRRK